MFGVEEREIEEISIAMLAIALAILIADIGLLGIFDYPLTEIAKQMGVLVITVGSGFILHEMAHKFAAQHYGAVAGFRMWVQGLLIMFVLAAFVGIIFAAPGAVYIYTSRLTKRQNGIISLAGPAMNIFLAILFLAALPLSVMHFGPKSIISQIALIGFSVNGILALFNLVPVFPLDGSKVMAWNPLIWLAAVCAAFLIYIGPMFLLF